jgi:hypothetical protein
MRLNNISPLVMELCLLVVDLYFNKFSTSPELVVFEAVIASTYESHLKPSYKKLIGQKVWIQRISNFADLPC